MEEIILKPHVSMYDNVTKTVYLGFKKIQSKREMFLWIQISQVGKSTWQPCTA